MMASCAPLAFAIANTAAFCAYEVVFEPANMLLSFLGSSTVTTRAVSGQFASGLTATTRVKLSLVLSLPRGPVPLV